MTDHIIPGDDDSSLESIELLLSQPEVRSFLETSQVWAFAQASREFVDARQHDLVNEIVTSTPGIDFVENWINRHNGDWQGFHQDVDAALRALRGWRDQNPEHNLFVEAPESVAIRIGSLKDLEDFLRVYETIAMEEARRAPSPGDDLGRWINCVIDALFQMPPVQARALTSRDTSSSHVLVPLFAVKCEGGATIVWNTSTSSHEVHFERGRAAALRVGTRSFPLVPTNNPKTFLVDGPQMQVAHELNEATQVELGDFRLS